MNGGNSDTSIEEEIAKEQRLIRIYEAELKLLLDQEEQRNAQQTTTVVDDDDGDDTTLGGPLDWILQLQDTESSMSSLYASLRTTQEEDDHSRLQPLIRGFCFTHIQKASEYTSYVFRGYFTSYPSVRACIRIFFERQEEKTRIQSIQFQLETEPDFEWLEKEIKARKDDLAAWMESVSTYLRFHKRRDTFLYSLQKQHPSDVSVEMRQSKALIVISRNGRELTSLIWGWKWKEGRDVLRLTRNLSRAALRQSQLDALVVVCDDKCEEALKVMLDEVQSSPPLYAGDAYAGDDDEAIESDDMDGAQAGGSGAAEEKASTASPEDSDAGR